MNRVYTNVVGIVGLLWLPLPLLSIGSGQNIIPLIGLWLWCVVWSVVALYIAVMGFCGSTVFGMELKMAYRAAGWPSVRELMYSEIGWGPSIPPRGRFIVRSYSAPRVYGELEKK